MVKSKNVVAALRRDVSFVWHAVIAVVFIGFVGLAWRRPSSTCCRSGTEAGYAFGG